MPSLRQGSIIARLRRDDRGAVATMFVILLATGVLLGMLALVVDIGLLYAEREELQSGADSAAIAIADQCALDGSANCATSAVTALAATYANANAKDGTSNVLQVCGKLPGGTWPACPAPVGNLTDCIPATPTDGRPYVEVRTGTRMNDGTFLLPPVFAQTLAGNGDYDGTTVRACARATVGTPGRGLGGHLRRVRVRQRGRAISRPCQSGPAFTSDHREVVLKLHDSQGPPPPGCARRGGGGRRSTCRAGSAGWMTGPTAGGHFQQRNLRRRHGQQTCRPPASTRLDEATTTRRTIVYLPIYQTVTKHGKEYNLSQDRRVRADRATSSAAAGRRRWRRRWRWRWGGVGRDQEQGLLAQRQLRLLFRPGALHLRLLRQRHGVRRAGTGRPGEPRRDGRRDQWLSPRDQTCTTTLNGKTRQAPHDSSHSLDRRRDRARRTRHRRTAAVRVQRGPAGPVGHRRGHRRDRHRADPGRYDRRAHEGRRPRPVRADAEETLCRPTP